jgi:uncharacterized protein (DUF433 family)
MNGTLCFTGTHVPVKMLFDYLLSGASIDRFLRDFPNVTPAHIEAFFYLVIGWGTTAAHAQILEHDR